MDWIEQARKVLANGNPCENCGRETREVVYEQGVPGIMGPGETSTVGE